MYYRERLVGDHRLVVSGAEILLRFNAEEIHLFTEKPVPGRVPPEDKLVQRSGGREVRVFSPSRARLMDLILDTVEKPARAQQANKPGATLLVGSADACGRRMVVVVAPDAGAYFVRTAYQMSKEQYRRRAPSKPAKWPPE